MAPATKEKARSASAPGLVSAYELPDGSTVVDVVCEHGEKGHVATSYLGLATCTKGHIFTAADNSDATKKKNFESGSVTIDAPEVLPTPTLPFHAVDSDYKARAAKAAGEDDDDAPVRTGGVAENPPGTPNTNPNKTKGAKTAKPGTTHHTGGKGVTKKADPS